VTVKCVVLDGTAVPSKPANLTVTYIVDIYQMMSTGVLETCRELEKEIYTKKKNCASI
jgi:hypothetical protein